jgi:hypothetical protein
MILLMTNGDVQSGQLFLIFFKTLNPKIAIVK